MFRRGVCWRAASLLFTPKVLTLAVLVRTDGGTPDRSLSRLAAGRIGTETTSGLTTPPLPGQTSGGTTYGDVTVTSLVVLFALPHQSVNVNVTV